MSSKQVKKSLKLYLNHKSGVLTRVSLVISRCLWNIESISLLPVLNQDYCWCNLVASGDEQYFQRIIGQLNRLVDVIDIEENLNLQQQTHEMVELKYRVREGQHLRQLEATNNGVVFEPTDNEHEFSVKLVGCRDELHRVEEQLSEKFDLVNFQHKGTVVINTF